MEINEELQVALSDMINKTIEGIDTAVTFTIDELPDVIQQLLAFEIISNVFEMTFAIVVSIALPTIAILAAKKITEDVEMDNSEKMAIMAASGGVTGFMCFLFGLLPAYGNIIELIKLTVAPKVWLIEYAADLVK